MEFEGELKAAVKAARKAGMMLKKHFGGMQMTSFKAHHEEVTKYDRLSEKMIVKTLKKQFPSYNFLTEEGDNFQENSEFTWIIDPLDGTRSYARGLQPYAVSIALARKKEIVLGVVFNPEENELFHAVKGSGGFLNNKKISAARTAELKDSLVYATSLNHSLAFVKKILGRVLRVRIITTTAYELCYVAKGEAEAGLIINGKPWDYSAAVLICEESGCKVTDLRRREANWNFDSKDLLISCEKIHDKLLKALKS